MHRRFIMQMRGTPAGYGLTSPSNMPISKNLRSAPAYIVAQHACRKS
jgi:hypothetical protein